MSHSSAPFQGPEPRTLDRKPAPALASSTSDPSNAVGSMPDAPTISLRKLPYAFGDESLWSMLLFSKDIVRAEFVMSDKAEDEGYSTAKACFRSVAGAYEAQERLNGKPNATKTGNMIVEVVQQGQEGGFASRRNTLDSTVSRKGTGSSSSNNSSIAAPNRKTSRYESAFQRHVGKPVVNDGTADSDATVMPYADEAYGAYGMEHQQRPDQQQRSYQQLPSMTRRLTNSQAATETPLLNFASLTLNTKPNFGNSASSPINSGLTSPSSMHSPYAMMSPGAMSGASAGGNYGMNYSNGISLPPVNPADQHPPCNTLYVGNLPLDTNEDELKALFCKQRGYKRLCFRTKGNGPMCFVEFDDTACASKSLNELYGHMLSNSVKSGIRLSFSKNPLGVRSGPANGMGPNTPMSPQGPSSGYSNGVHPPPGFGSHSGPPPGLAAAAQRAAPGFGGHPSMPDGFNGTYGNRQNGAYAPTGFGMTPYRAQNPTNGFSPTFSRAQLASMGASHMDAVINGGRRS